MKRKRNSDGYSGWSKRRTISTGSPTRSGSSSDSSSGGPSTESGSISSRVKVRSRIVNRADQTGGRTSPMLGRVDGDPSTISRRSTELSSSVSAPSTPQSSGLGSSSSSSSISISDSRIGSNSGVSSTVDGTGHNSSFSVVSSPYAADIDEDGPCMHLLSPALPLSSPPNRTSGMSSSTSHSSLRRGRFPSLTVIPEDDSTSSCWSTGATKASSPALSGLNGEQQESVALDEMVDPMADDLEELLSFANVTDEALVAEQQAMRDEGATSAASDLDFDTLLYKLASLDVSNNNDNNADEGSGSARGSDSRALMLHSSSAAAREGITDGKSTEECPICKEHILSDQFGQHVSNCVSEIPEERRRQIQQEVQQQIDADEAYARELIQSSCDDGMEWRTDYWVECPVCWMKLSIGDSINRHVNRCLDRQSRGEKKFGRGKQNGKQRSIKDDSEMHTDDGPKTSHDKVMDLESLDDSSKEKIGGLLESFMGSGVDPSAGSAGSSSSSSSASASVRPLSGREMIACANSLLRQPKGSYEFDTMLSMFETLGFNQSRMQRVVTSHANYARKPSQSDRDGSVGPAASSSSVPPSGTATRKGSAMDTDSSTRIVPGRTPPSPSTVLLNPFGSEGVLDPFSGRKSQSPFPGTRVGRIASDRIHGHSDDHHTHSMWSLDKKPLDDECDADDDDDEIDDELKLALSVPIEERPSESGMSSSHAWDILSTVANPSRSPKDGSLLADTSSVSSAVVVPRPPPFDIHAHSISAGAGVDRMNDATLIDERGMTEESMNSSSLLAAQRVPSPALQSMRGLRAATKMSRSPTPTTGSEPPPLTSGARGSRRLRMVAESARPPDVRDQPPPPLPGQMDSSMSGANSREFENIPLPSEDDL